MAKPKIGDPRFFTDAQLLELAAALQEQHRYDWPANARPEQVEPKDYRFWLMMCGRGWGKTRVETETARKWAEDYPGIRIGVICQTHIALRDTIFDGASGLTKVIPQELWRPQDFKRGLGDVSLKLKNGSFIRGFTAGQPEELRGPEFDAFIWDEFAAWPKNLAEDTVANCLATMRNVRKDFNNGRGKIVIGTTPKRVKHLRDMVKMADNPDRRIVITRGSSRDNPHFGDENLADLEAMYGGTRRGRQELEGELLEDVEGSLWSDTSIDAARWPSFVEVKGEMVPNPLPKFDMVITGIDPSGSAKGDATGVVTLAFVRATKQIFVLECASTGGLAEDRYNNACRSAYRHNANLVVVEGSYGGDNNVLAFTQQWKHLQQTGEFDRDCPRVELSNLKGDKVAKVSPVAALYEQQVNKPDVRRIWHVEVTPGGIL